jgi:hypothetical protein
MPENSWNFAQANGRKKETLTFRPFLSMNDYAGLGTALLAGTGIGDLPPLVLAIVTSRGPLRVFKEFATQMAPTLFPTLPT